LLWRFSSRPSLWAVVAQFLDALVGIAIGANFFVSAMESISYTAGIPPGLIFLVLAPLATELPENFNSAL
jgi:cation:H+ antiporter